MNYSFSAFRKSRRIAAASAVAVLICSCTALADVAFLGVAAGDVSDHDATLWTRAVDANAPAPVHLTLQVSTDPSFSQGLMTLADATSAARDYTLKLDVTGLQPGTTYFYRFVGPNAETSNVGKFKTAPSPSTPAAVKFAFSGDMDGLMRPYALASTVPAQNLDFYVNLGDVIYETGSNVAGNAGTPNLNSPAVTVSGSIPAPTSTGATQAQLFAEYSRKYREQFLAVNAGGQNALRDFYAAQGNYTLYDNHELGNRQYINGGALAGGPVADFSTGAGVDARLAINDVNPSGPFMNKSGGFITLQQVYLNYQPVADRGVIVAPADPRTDSTKQLYFAQRWGKNAIFVNVDDRSYRDIRLKTSANADDTGARAGNPARTMLGATQLNWLEQALLSAQTAGVAWKFVAVSDPIDQIGPIGGALSGIVNSSGNPSYSPVAADGGKSWIGGYRAERNALLKFIADHQITNVVFLATDDHQNRVNELTYSPTGQTEVQSSYVKVPYCFEIVCGPLGATGPDLFLNHDFASIKTIADSLAAAQVAAGVEPFGLIGYPGLKNVAREGDANASTSPSVVDFYSPDTFNYSILEVSADGKMLTVRSIGIRATPQNSALEYGANGNTVREIASFQIETADLPNQLAVVRSGYALNRRTNSIAQQITISNTGTVPVVGPIHLVVDNLSSNTTLLNPTGQTANNAPAGSPYITVVTGTLAPGATVTTTLQFTVPTSGSVSYATRVVTGTVNP